MCATSSLSHSLTYCVYCQRGPKVQITIVNQCRVETGKQPVVDSKARGSGENLVKKPRVAKWATIAPEVEVSDCEVFDDSFEENSLPRFPMFGVWRQRLVLEGKIGIDENWTPFDGVYERKFWRFEAPWVWWRRFCTTLAITSCIWSWRCFLDLDGCKLMDITVSQSQLAFWKYVVNFFRTVSWPA